MHKSSQIASLGGVLGAELLFRRNCVQNENREVSLNERGFERKTKRTRMREFLDEMNLVVP